MKLIISISFLIVLSPAFGQLNENIPFDKLKGSWCLYRFEIACQVENQFRDCKTKLLINDEHNLLGNFRLKTDSTDISLFTIINGRLVNSLNGKSNEINLFRDTIMIIGNFSSNQASKQFKYYFKKVK